MSGGDSSTRVRLEGTSGFRTHQISIAGQRLTVRSAAATEYVESLASGIEARVRQATEQGAGSMSAVLLAALDLADELARAQRRAASARDTMHTLTGEMLEALAAAKPRHKKKRRGG